MATTPASVTVISVSTGFQERIKRVQATLVIPKSSTVSSGWLAFYRQDPDTQTLNTGLEINNPQVLRPKVYVNNSDHAIYVELYLEAITLDGGASLHLVVGGMAGPNITIPAVAKWYTEKVFHS